MVEPGKREFRSVRRKKRKGFCGHNGANKQPKLTKEANQDGGVEGEVEAREESDPSETDDLPVRANVSASKLQNSSFSSYEEREGILTRNKTISVGLRVASGNVDQVASGFKLQDATLLSECIASAAICSSCRNPQSRLKLYQRDYQREGLAECLLLRCSICSHETNLKFSKKLGGVGGGAHEVNRRSVFASRNLARLD